MNTPSIRRKLLAALLITSTSVLLLAGAVLVYYEYSDYRRTTAHDLQALAQTIAANSAGALAFDDEKVAAEILSGLRYVPDVRGARLYDRHGEIYVTWSPPGEAPLFPHSPGPCGVRLQDGRLIAVQPVMQAEGRIGTLLIVESLQGTYQRVLAFAMVVVVVVAGAGGVAFLLASFFRRRIAQPILRLADTARRVSENKDFSLRAPPTTPDELGQLTGAFNGMLSEIQDQQRRLLDELAARAKAEADLRDSERKLERTVLERTAQLREANDNLQNFSHTAAHDLRAPLRSIRNFASMLLEDCGGTLNSQAADYFQRIIAAAQKMDGLLTDLLEYSRISQAELRPEPVSVQAAVADALAALQSEIESKQARVQVARELPVVLGHRATLVLLIQNLVANALKFVPAETRPSIRIYSEPTSSSGLEEASVGSPGEPRSEARFIRVVVQDNGIGIAISDQPKLFNAFQRLQSATQYPGTGLGLAMVKKGAERMGGQVGFKSVLGQGSCFWIVLPAADSADGDRAH